jgi:hypothetical protein
MSTTLKPFGLKPSFHTSGLDRSTPFTGTNSFVTGTPNYSANYSLTSGQAFYQFQPVGLDASGNLTIASTTGTGGATSTLVYGVFDGVEYTNSDGRRSVSKYATKATLDASTQIIFWIFQDPSIVYEIQAAGSIASTKIGAQFNFSATTGYTTADGVSIGVGGAGFSTTALNPTAVASAAQGQVRVVGLGREVAYPTGELNAWGDTYTIVQVQIANNSFVAAKAAP